MNEWFRFFLGTPRRFMYTMIVLGLATVAAFPGLIRMAAERLIAELAPLLGPALAVIIVFAGLRVILFGRGGGKKK